MVHYLAHDLIVHLIVFQTVLLMILLSNIWITRRARHHSHPEALPMVSVLLPARNEEGNITNCVRSLLAQDYPSYEVLVLDDQSNDGTRDVLTKIANTDSRLRVLDGEPLSGKAVGKNWACIQLARQARGDLLFFTDADTHHHKDTLRAAVTSLIGEEADLLTGFPRQEVHSWGEVLLVPFFSWILFNLIPLALGYRLQTPALSSAVGQLMLFRRDSYLAIGGHESVNTSVVDDLSLARRIKSARLRWRVVHISDLVSCRMYHSSQEAIDGFTKNMFAVFDYRLVPFLLAFTWLLVMFWEPVIVLAMAICGRVSQTQPATIAFCIVLSLISWLIHFVNTGIPVGFAFLYPFTILANVVVAIRSCVYSLRGAIEWKGRRIARIRWRWF